MTEERPRMWAHTIDYCKDRGTSGLINRGFWLHGLPRLIPLCRLLGHQPVVDGVDMRYGSGERRSRWVACNRCGIRTDPQGPIGTDLVVGQPYLEQLPGQWPASPRGGVGGQLVAAGGHHGFSAHIKIGNAGSEHVLAAHLHLDQLVALYLHTEDHGRGVQRRLNPHGYDSRVIELAVHGGHLRWELWARRGHWSRSVPWWMNGSVEIDPRTLLWGPKRYSYDNLGEPVVRTVRMPHGDDHQVTLQLQRQSLGRPRLARRAESWVVDWDTSPGIPTETADRGRVQGSGVQVSAATAQGGSWPEEACAAIAVQMTADRTRYGYTAAVTS